MVSKLMLRTTFATTQRQHLQQQQQQQHLQQQQQQQHLQQQRQQQHCLVIEDKKTSLIYLKLSGEFKTTLIEMMIMTNNNK